MDKNLKIKSRYQNYQKYIQDELDDQGYQDLIKYFRDNNFDIDLSFDRYLKIKNLDRLIYQISMIIYILNIKI